MTGEQMAREMAEQPAALAGLAERRAVLVDAVRAVVPDDLRGWYENKNGERVREAGVLESFGLEAADAEALIMRARVAMGWIEPEPEPEPEAEEVAELEGGEVDPETFAAAEMLGEARDA